MSRHSSPSRNRRAPDGPRRLRVILLAAVTAIPMLGLVSPAAWSHQPGGSITVPPATTNITADGVLQDAEWSEAAKLTWRMFNATRDSVPLLKYEWASPGLGQALVGAFFLVDRTVDLGDGFALLFDTRHNGGDAPQTDDFSLGINRQGRASVFVGNGQTWVEGTTLLAPFTVIVLRVNAVSDGWQGELKLGLNVTAPPVLGFMAQQADRMVPATNLPPGSNAGVPNTWGDLVFPPPTAPGTVTVTQTATATVTQTQTITTTLTETTTVIQTGVATVTATVTQPVTTTVTQPITQTVTTTTVQPVTVTSERVVTQAPVTTTETVMQRESLVLTLDTALLAAVSMIAVSIAAALVIRRRP